MKTVSLELKDIVYVRKQQYILKDINLLANSGEFIGLLGPNGSGKSTLLKVMANLLKAKSGFILANQQPLSVLKDKEIAKIITYMPQSTIVDYSFTAEQIVQMGRHPHLKRWQLETKEDRQIVEKAMKYTGIFHLKDRFVNTLSGGERQLVFIAKAIAQQTDILLLDEPTSDLDIYHQVEICQMIRDLTKQGKIVIAAIHDLNLAAQYCDRILLLKSGKIKAFAKTEEAITKENIEDVYDTFSYVYRETQLNKIQIIPYETKKEKSRMETYV